MAMATPPCAACAPSQCTRSRATAYCQPSPAPGAHRPRGEGSLPSHLPSPRVGVPDACALPISCMVIGVMRGTRHARRWIADGAALLPGPCACAKPTRTWLGFRIQKSAKSRPETNKGRRPRVDRIAPARPPLPRRHVDPQANTSSDGWFSPAVDGVELSATPEARPFPCCAAPL